MCVDTGGQTHEVLYPRISISGWLPFLLRNSEETQDHSDVLLHHHDLLRNSNMNKQIVIPNDKIKHMLKENALDAVHRSQTDNGHVT